MQPISFFSKWKRKSEPTAVEAVCTHTHTLRRLAGTSQQTVHTTHAQLDTNTHTYTHSQHTRKPAKSLCYFYTPLVYSWTARVCVWATHENLQAVGDQKSSYSFFLYSFTTPPPSHPWFLTYFLWQRNSKQTEKLQGVFTGATGLTWKAAKVLGQNRCKKKRRSRENNDKVSYRLQQAAKRTKCVRRFPNLFAVSLHLSLSLPSVPLQHCALEYATAQFGIVAGNAFSAASLIRIRYSMHKRRAGIDRCSDPITVELHPHTNTLVHPLHTCV